MEKFILTECFAKLKEKFDLQKLNQKWMEDPSSSEGKIEFSNYLLNEAENLSILLGNALYGLLFCQWCSFSFNKEGLFGVAFVCNYVAISLLLSIIRGESLDGVDGIGSDISFN